MYTGDTFDMEYIVDMVYTVDMVNNVDIVYTVDSARTIWNSSRWIGLCQYL